MTQPGSPTNGRQPGSNNGQHGAPYSQVPNPYSAEGSDENIWRRPDGSMPPPPAAPASPAVAYSGPPPMTPAGPEWRPRMLIQVPEANRLPAQDDAALDEQDRNNATVTKGIGLLAGAIGLILLFVLCGRTIF